MQRIEPFFNSVYNRKFGEYSITAMNRFGVKFVHTAKSKRERDQIKAQWKSNLIKKLPPVVEHTSIKAPKKAISRIDPIHYYYTEACEGVGMKYSIENFHAKMFDDSGIEYFIMIMRDGKATYVDKLPVAKFFLMNKKQKSKLKFDERYVNYWKSYKCNKGYYLIVVLPNIKFRNNQIGFYLGAIYGKEISYLEAKRVWSKIDSIGFEKFEISFSDIPKARSYKHLAIDEYSRRIQRKHLNKLNNEFRYILKNECVDLQAEIEKHPDKMRVRVPKHYRMQKKLGVVNRRFDAPVDKMLKKEKEQNEEEFNKLNRSE